MKGLHWHMLFHVLFPQEEDENCTYCQINVVPTANEKAGYATVKDMLDMQDPLDRYEDIFYVKRDDLFIPIEFDKITTEVLKEVIPRKKKVRCVNFLTNKGNKYIDTRPFDEPFLPLAKEKALGILQYDIRNLEKEKEECDLIGDYINSCTNHEATRVMMRVLLAELVFNLKTKMFYFIKGVPNSGKTSLANILPPLIGAPIKIATGKEITAISGASSFELEPLLFSYALMKDESEGHIDPTLLNRLAEREKLCVNVKYRNAREIEWFGHLVVTSNEILKTRCTTGVRERLVPMLFDQYHEASSKKNREFIESLKDKKRVSSSLLYHACLGLDYIIKYPLLRPNLNHALGSNEIYELLLDSFKKREPGEVVKIREAEVKQDLFARYGIEHEPKLFKYLFTNALDLNGIVIGNEGESILLEFHPNPLVHSDEKVVEKFKEIQEKEESWKLLIEMNEELPF